MDEVLAEAVGPSGDFSVSYHQGSLGEGWVFAAGPAVAPCAAAVPARPWVAREDLAWAGPAETPRGFQRWAHERCMEVRLPYIRGNSIYFFEKWPTASRLAPGETKGRRAAKTDMRPDPCVHIFSEHWGTLPFASRHLIFETYPSSNNNYSHRINQHPALAFRQAVGTMPLFASHGAIKGAKSGRRTRRLQIRSLAAW